MSTSKVFFSVYPKMLFVLVFISRNDDKMQAVVLPSVTGRSRFESWPPHIIAQARIVRCICILVFTYKLFCAYFLILAYIWA